MPYIQSFDRDKVDAKIAELAEAINDTSNPDGTINYCITRLLQQCGLYGNYENLQRAIGVLECAKLEFYRRAAVPYEDKKRHVNGDAFDI